jgi:hypothetical protein
MLYRASVRLSQKKFRMRLFSWERFYFSIAVAERGGFLFAPGLAAEFVLAAAPPAR